MLKLIAKKPKFKGALNAPLIITLPPKPPRGAAAQILLKKQYESELKIYFLDYMSQYKKQLSKMNLLLDHFYLSDDDVNCWFKLSFELAQLYVPGFQIKHRKSGGRPKKWDSTLYLALYIAVENYINQSPTKSRRPNVSDACRILSRKYPWNNLIKNKDTLRNEYQRACKSPFVLLLESIRSTPTKTSEDKKLEAVLIEMASQKVAQQL